MINMISVFFESMKVVDYTGYGFTQRRYQSALPSVKQMTRAISHNARRCMCHKNPLILFKWIVVLNHNPWILKNQLEESNCFPHVPRMSSIAAMLQYNRESMINSMADWQRVALLEWRRKSCKMKEYYNTIFQNVITWVTVMLLGT